MPKASGKGTSKDQRGKKLGVKKQLIKDLEPNKAKDIKGGVFPADRKRF